MLNNLSRKSMYVAVSALLLSTTAIAGVVAQQQAEAPASVKSDNPASNFTVKDGEVTHAGLIWQSCLVGQTFANGACTGTAKEFANWSDALNYLTPQQQADGWRVPNIKELMSITDNTRAYPAVDASVFAFATSLSYKEDDGYQGGFRSGSSPYLWSSTPVRHNTKREDGWTPILKEKSVTATKENAKNADGVFALDLGYGVPQQAYRDGKSRNEHQKTQWSNPDPDQVEKARYLLLVKDAS